MNIGLLTFAVILLVLAIGMYTQTDFSQKVSKGIADDPRPANHLINYVHPDYYQDTTTSYKDKSKEDTDWTGTYQDEHVMWIGGNGDTIWE